MYIFPAVAPGPCSVSSTASVLRVYRMAKHSFLASCACLMPESELGTAIGFVFPFL